MLTAFYLFCFGNFIKMNSSIYVKFLIGVFNQTLSMYANPSIFKVSECLFSTDGVKQVSKIDVILLSS